MQVVRYCKTALVASVALLFSLIAFGNLTDYGSNWPFVQHVLSMDTIFPDSTLKWRAITSPALQSAAYWLIIGWEALTAAVLWVGAIQLLRVSSRRGLAEAKTTAIVGLTLAFLLFVVGFVVIGGEWFAMWQSKDWNGQGKAFEFIGLTGMVLLALLIPEAGED